MVWECSTFSVLCYLVVFPKNISIFKEIYWEHLINDIESSFEKTKAETFQQDGTLAHSTKILKE